MRIVLDTNIFYNDPLLQSTSARVLLDQIPRLGHTLHVPKVVFDEIVNKYPERLRETKNKLDRTQSEISHLTGRSLVSPFSEDDLKNAIEEYPARLEERLQSVKATISPYPDIPHETLVRRALDRKAPFPNGKTKNADAYRDALIWINILNIVEESADPLVLITNDHDFVEKPDLQLYPELVEELKECGFPVERFEAYPSVKAFVDKHITPVMEEPDAWQYIRDQLNAGTYSRLKLDEVLESHLQNTDLPYRGWGSDREQISPAEVGLPSCAETTTLNYVENLDEVKVTQVKELTSGELLIEVEAEADITFDFFIFKSDWWGLNEEDEDIWVIDLDWNDHYVYAQTFRSVHLKASLMFDPATPRITSIELDSITAISGDKDVGSVMRQVMDLARSSRDSSDD